MPDYMPASDAVISYGVALTGDYKIDSWEWALVRPKIPAGSANDPIALSTRRKLYFDAA
jgi:hypothetical protein